jgi:transcription elongation factor GreA
MPLNWKHIDAFPDRHIGPDEAEPARGKISILAPLARTLIGKKVGDTVTAQLPAGKKTFEILAANFPWPEGT